MDFSLVELNDAQQAFLSDLNSFLDDNLTPGVYERQRLSGDHFDEEFHRALGTKGWIMPRWPVADGGAGLDAVCTRLLELEMERREAPRATLPMLRLIWPAVDKHGRPELARELKPQVANGSVRFCLGYTEPNGGSDIAAAKVRAVRDGDDWIVNGSKVFTSNAQSAQYTFLITRTDPTVPKHKGLTMFLAPLNAPGIEVQALRMLGDTRTNVVYFDDARVPDRYRIGAVNHGWSVIHGPLDAEHVGEDAASGLDDISVGGAYMRYLQRSLDATVRWARETSGSDGTRPIDDQVLLAHLGMLATQVEAALCTPGPFGRVKCADVAIDGSQQLLSLVGIEGTVTRGQDGAIGDGVVEFAHRVAQATSIYGGTTEVFRAMIAEHSLGLPRPDYPGRKMLAPRSGASPLER
jgi:alkylation response protein AidB-like acyl-CoA dehydrogenase